MSLHNLYYLHETGGKKKQEDYIWPTPGKATAESRVFIVCDGVGGSENGEMASRLVATFAGQALTSSAINELSQESIIELLKQAQQELISYATKNGLNGDMATTFSLLVLFPEKAFIAWCGDTRVYHVRKGDILFRTEDHSLVNTLVKNGEITEEEARLHPQRNIILNAIRADDSPVEAEGVWISSLQDGDYFMLCTDGLLENITDKDIQYLSTDGQADPKDVIQYLQEKCLGKTRDNYSMYLLQVQGITHPSGTKKKYRNLLTGLIALLAGVAVLAFIMKMDNQTPASGAVNDSAAARPSVNRPAPTAVRATNTDSLPEIEIISDADTVQSKDKADSLKKNH